MPAQGGEMRGSPTTAIGLVLPAFRDKGITRADQVVGFPSWADSTRFEFLGTVDHSMSRETLLAQLPAMLRRTLENRFQLKAHIEQRSTPVYALVVARADGHLGTSVKESTVDCAAAEQQVQEMLKTVGPAGMAARARAGAAPVGCGTNGGGTSGRLIGRGVHLSALTSALAVDRPVVDRTGRSGRYDFELSWTPPAPPGSTDPGTAAVISEGPSVFTALQEQLGLKLERREEPMDVLVVDHIEPPTPN